MNQRWIAAILCIGVGLAVGCERPEEVSPTEASQAQEELAAVEVDEEADEDEAIIVDERQETADKADQLLRQRLMGRVLEVAQEEGFAAAVTICHDEAGPLTEEVGDELGVQIGRFSDRLRNPENQGPDWVESFIEEADGEAHYAANDTLRAVKPISIAEPCLNCHGQTEELAEGVASALEEYYPDDEATGYELGDLRGWVWVEVR